MADIMSLVANMMDRGNAAPLIPYIPKQIRPTLSVGESGKAPFEGAQELLRVLKEPYDWSFLDPNKDNSLADQMDAAYKRRPPAPTPAEMEYAATQGELSQAERVKALYDKIKSPQREELTMPNMSALRLPDVPTRQRPQAEPVSALAAGILGLVSPQYAGDFGAAALHGAIQENERQNQARQEQFAQEVQKRIALHADEMKRANIEAEIANENRAIRYENSLADTSAKKKSADLEGKIAGLMTRGDLEKGMADAAHRHADSDADVQRIREQITMRLKHGEAAETRRINSLKILEGMAEREQRDRELRQHQKDVLEETKHRDTMAHEDRQALIRSGFYRVGYTPPTVPGGSPTPTPKSKLPIKVQSDIQHQRAMEDAARTRETRIAAKQAKTGGAKPQSAQEQVAWDKMKHAEKIAVTALEKYVESKSDSAERSELKTASDRAHAYWAQTQTDYEAELDKRPKASPAPKKTGKAAPSTVRKQFRDPSGTVFWAHVENGKWVRE